VKFARGDRMQVGRNHFLPVTCLSLLAVCACAADMSDLPPIKPIISCVQLGQVDISEPAGAQVSLKAEELDTPKGKYCKVTGNIDPAIGFEVDLPVEHWTQRFAQAGCGAYCGNIGASINQAGSCAPALNGDLVVAGNDLGHQGGMGGPGASGQPEGAFGADPQKRIDFAYRANHVTAMASKALIQAFYGQPQKYAYFVGCSDGGREALIEAERFPNDFDGIAAGAPVAIINVASPGPQQRSLPDRPLPACSCAPMAGQRREAGRKLLPSAASRG